MLIFSIDKRKALCIIIYEKSGVKGAASSLTGVVIEIGFRL